MPITATRATSVQPWRVVVTLDAWDPLLLEPERWSITRPGGAPTPAVLAWQAASTVAELALREPLVPGEVYSVSVPSLSIAAVSVAYHRATPATELGDDLFAADDPEGEAYGVDWDWCGEAPDVSGDFPEVRGIACLRHDLAAVAMTSRGELPHRPATGLGLRERVNGAAPPAALLELQGEVLRAFLEDDRVEAAEVSVSAAGGGATVIRATVRPRPVNSPPVPLTVRI